MQIEQIRVRNFRAFKDVTVRGIPRLAIFVGANGTGKSTLLSVFGFLRDAMTTNVRVALSKLGGSRGIREVRSRDSEGPITIEIKYRPGQNQPLVTYSMSIGERRGRPVVEREILAYRRFSSGRPWHFLDFRRGKGYAVTNEAEEIDNVRELDRDEQELKSPDLLAIKGLAQFKRFPAVVALGNLIERWHISDFHIDRARREQEAGLPFLARHVSDGTIKMFAYLALLNDPDPHSLLCVERPENHLYPTLLEELAEDFRSYTRRGGQVFVSTHSPDFLNAARLNEVFWLTKTAGYTSITRARDNEQVAAYMNDGDKMGYLWRQGFFDGAATEQR